MKKERHPMIRCESELKKKEQTIETIEEIIQK